MRLLPALLMSTILFAAPAFAQDMNTPAPQPVANQTILNISATEHKQVQEDILTASLRVEKTGPDAKAIQNEINTLMQSALEKTKPYTSIKISTGGYYVYDETPPVAPNAKADPAAKKTWHGSQNIELHGTAADDLLKLTGELQALGLVMDGLNYSLSPEKADEAKDSLMEAALAKVKVRAERAAKAMNKTHSELVEISVDSSDNVVRPMPMRAMAMAASDKEVADVAARPGEADITLTVTARALLK